MSLRQEARALALAILPALAAVRLGAEAGGLESLLAALQAEYARVREALEAEQRRVRPSPRASPGA